ncbi:hypothetical protein KI387_037533, partial [Taxus chinensis]
ARMNLMALLDTIIERPRKGDEIKDDFIQSMISRDGLSQEERLKDLEIKDNCLALLLAGHATTGATLTWVMKYLEENPDVKEILMEEYNKIQEKNTGLTWEDISHMPYTSKVIFETLRMENPTPWISRGVLPNTSFGGFNIKKGWNVTIDGCGLHYDPDHFEAPTKFKPSRFD